MQVYFAHANTFTEDSTSIEVDSGLTIHVFDFVTITNATDCVFNTGTRNTSRVAQKGIELNNPSTSSDLINLSNEVYLQKSQLGGGRPMIRGLATLEETSSSLQKLSSKFYKETLLLAL